MKGLFCAVALGGACAACEGLGLSSPDFERMIRQAKLESYEASPHFEDGRGMRTPPGGTRPHGYEAPQTGREDGEYVTQIRGPLTRAFLTRGRARFDVFCAPCHGVLGTGVTPVAENMRLRRPPSLVEEPIRSYPLGRVFEATSAGYGLMPSYASALPEEDLWAVAAYVQALQLSRGVSLNDLPEGLRREALEELK